MDYGLWIISYKLTIIKTLIVGNFMYSLFCKIKLPLAIVLTAFALLSLWTTSTVAQPTLNSNGPKVEFLRELSSNERIEMHCPDFGGRCLLIDQSGTAVTRKIFEGGSGFRENDKTTAIKHSGKYGLLNRNGTWLIGPTFDLAKDFTRKGHPLARVRINGKWGYVNVRGEWAVFPKFDRAAAFRNGFAKVKVLKKYGFINTDGKIIVPIKYDTIYVNEFSLGLVAAEHETKKKWGFINEQGNWEIAPTFSYASNFSANGLALVKVKDKYGYINRSGKMAFPARFESSSDFTKHDVTTAQMNGKSGIINTKGEWIVEPIYQTIFTIYDDVTTTVFRQDGLYGVMDFDGNIIFDGKEVDLIYNYNDKQLATFENNGKRGVIDGYGYIIVPAIYHSIKFTGNLLRVTFGQDGKNMGFLNLQGEPVTFSIAEFQLAELQALQALNSNELKSAKKKIEQLKKELSSTTPSKSTNTACKHIYVGQRINQKVLMGLGLVIWKVAGVNSSTGRATLVDTKRGEGSLGSKEETCSRLPY